MAAPPVDDALVQIEQLCTALALTSDALEAAADVLEGDQAGPDDDTIDETALVQAVTAALAAAEAAEQAVEQAAAAVGACAEAARDGRGEEVLPAQAALEAAGDGVEAAFAKWTESVAALPGEVDADGFAPAIAALDGTAAAAKAATDALRSGGEALGGAANAAGGQLLDAEAGLAGGMEAAAAAAYEVRDGLAADGWAEAWAAAAGVVTEAASAAAEDVRDTYESWRQRVEELLTGQEAAVEDAAETAGEEVAARADAIDSHMSDWRAARQQLRGQLVALAGAVEAEAGACDALQALGPDLAIALGVAAVVEAALRALAEN